jgi:eukaryotic-like serine/threonine-protein kinase
MPNQQSEATLVHPDRQQVIAFGQGKLADAAAAEIEKHVAECVTCCGLLKQINDDTLVELARAAAGNTPGPARTPGRTEAWAPNTQPAKVQLQLDEIPPELRDHPRYRIVERLGEGGMGVVYKAEHRMMERLVALKVISLDFTANPTAVDRFRQEVRAAAKLSHANIVTAHDAEQAGDLHFLVMEYVEGISLARLVQKKGPLPPAQVALFVRQVAQGLHHAHTHNMIHRDIKPHNLMVTRKGQVKILDFGLARFANLTGTHLTKAEMVVGTPDYMAPEQARDSRKVDTRTDLYSLGCTMYFLLTGQPPFEAESAIALMFKHCEDEPVPVSEFRDDVPEELLAIMRKLMAKNPADRYQTPAEAATSLMPFIRPLSQSLDLTQKAALEDEVPVAELLDGSASPTMEESRKTVPTVKRPPKRRPKVKSWRKKLPMVRLGILLLILGMLAALLVAKQWPENSNDGGPPDNRQAALQSSQPRQPAREEGRREVQPSRPSSRPPERPSGDQPIPPTNKQDDGPAVVVPGDSHGSGNRQPPPSTGDRRVLFLLPEKLYYADYGPVRDVLEREGCKVETASYVAECYATDQGGRSVKPDYSTLDQLRGANYDAIVFVGEDPVPYANLQLPSSRQAGRLLKEMQQADKYITAICKGQYILLQHGYLTGKRKAFSKYVGEGLKRNPREEKAQNYFQGAEWKQVVVHDKLITGSGPEAAQEFGQTLAAELKKVRK